MTCGTYLLQQSALLRVGIFLWCTAQRFYHRFNAYCMLGTSTSFAPFVAEDDDDIVDPGLVPADGVSEEGIVEDDDTEDLDLRTAEEEDEEM